MNISRLALSVASIICITAQSAADVILTNTQNGWVKVYKGIDNCRDLQDYLGLEFTWPMSCKIVQSGGVEVVSMDPVIHELLVSSLNTLMVLDTQYSPLGEYDFSVFVGQPLKLTYRNITTGLETWAAEISIGQSHEVVFEWAKSVGSAYCSATVNSTGSAGSLFAVGSDSVARGNIVLLAEGLPAHSFGFFLTSPAQGYVLQPGGSQGVLCLGGAIGRYAVPGQLQNSGASGRISLSLDLAQHPTPTGFVTVQSGETWYFQGWYRDSFGGGLTSNLTDGIEVTFR